MIVSPLRGVNVVIPGFKCCEGSDFMTNEQCSEERLLSIVIPVLNEGENVGSLTRRTIAVVAALPCRGEIIIVDDASSDDTVAQVRAAQSLSAVPLTLVEMEGRVGQHLALLHGFAASRGDFVISLDGDLQNPPESIPEILRLLEEGHDHVVGRRAHRRDPLHRRMVSWLLLRFAPFFSGVPRHDYGSMYRGYTRALIAEILRTAGPSPFIPAIACRAAGSFVEVAIPHHQRVVGESKYDWSRLLRIAFDLTIGGTEAPFHWLSLAGVAVVIGTVAIGGAGLVMALALGHRAIFHLWLLPELLLLGVLAAAIGLVGVYVQRTFGQLSAPKSISAKVAPFSPGWLGLPRNAVVGIETQAPPRRDPLRILFCGYREVGHGVLEHLLDRGAPVVAVATHPGTAEEAGIWPSVADLAVSKQVPLLLSGKVHSPAFLGTLESLGVNMIISAYYRRILPPEVLARAHRGAFNLHPSLLPAYRGRAPLNWVLLRGERTTGVTLHEMIAEPDAGPIVAQVEIPIAADDDAGSLAKKLATAAIELFADLWPALEKGEYERRPQDESRAFRVGKRTPEDGRIDWRLPGEEIRNLVRAVAAPFPGAFSGDGEQRITIWRCVLSTVPCSSHGHPGDLGESSEGLGFRCGDDLLLFPLELQFGSGAKLHGTEAVAALAAWRSRRGGEAAPRA
jgi:methionyl-tRNA formyltransferase